MEYIYHHRQSIFRENYIYLYSYSPCEGTHQERCKIMKKCSQTIWHPDWVVIWAWHIIINSLRVFVWTHEFKVSGMSTFSQTTGTNIEFFAGSIAFRTRVVVIVHEHENDVHLYLLWILQTWTDSFEIWYAGYYRVCHNRE